ncbi:DUF2721 domain-containing protein [Coleofasciculus sp. G2-EDA-02]|uniref:DUF2721 domain-containing protein n=1 Tax=Coleofasciculus sp. G2-EDA-02 TaxID=3069529 RepID=UPI0032F2C3F0
MDQMSLTVTQVIQAILAPAVMISSSGLFFLGLNARQSSLLNRIRLLNNERRIIAKELMHQGQFDSGEDIRFLSLEHQLNNLLRRAWYVRNSTLCDTLAVVFFVLTSFAIALHFFMGITFLAQLPIFLFITGMFLVLVGVICLAIDEVIAYSVILLEVQDKQAVGFNLFGRLSEPNQGEQSKI